MLKAIGGRAIHPVNTRVGGFYRAPLPIELNSLAQILRQALDDALATTAWVAGFDFPDDELDCDLLAVTTPGLYAIESGTVTSASGLTFPAQDFSAYVVEHQVPHSTALHAAFDGRLFLTGPAIRPRQALAVAAGSGPAPGIAARHRSRRAVRLDQHGHRASRPDPRWRTGT